MNINEQSPVQQLPDPVNTLVCFYIVSSLFLQHLLLHNMNVNIVPEPTCPYYLGVYNALI